MMLNSNKNDMGQLFRDVMDGFDEDLPIRVWDNVNSELKNAKERKKVVFYLSIAASVALIIAFSSGYYLALNNSKLPQYSNSDTKNTFYNKALVNTFNADSNFTNNIPEIKITKNYNNENNNNQPPEKLQIKNTLSSQQTNKEQQSDKISIINDSTGQNLQELIVTETPNQVTEDTVKKDIPVIDIYKDFNNQVDIINKNQNINNNIPKDKLQEPVEVSGKWSLAEQFSPVGYMGNSQKEALADAAVSNYNGYNQSNNEISNNKKILLVYATGMSFKYQLNRKWAIKSGLFYATGEVGSGQQHKQLEIPVMANYNLIDKKFTWELNAGFGPNFLFSAGEKSINYSGLAGTTLGYNISQKISVIIEPTIKYNFSYPSSYIFHYYPVSFAIYTGLSYRF